MVARLEQITAKMPLSPRDILKTDDSFAFARRQTGEIVDTDNDMIARHCEI